EPSQGDKGARRQAGGAAARHGSGGDDVYSRRRAGEEGPGRAGRVADAARDRPPGQAHRGPRPEDKGLRAALGDGRPGLRRLGRLPRRRLRGRGARGGAGEGAPERRPRRAQGGSAPPGGLRAAPRRQARGRPQKGVRLLARGRGDGPRRHPPLQGGERPPARGDGQLRLDGGAPGARRRGALDVGGLRGRARRLGPVRLSLDGLRVRGDHGRGPLRQRGAEPRGGCAGAHRARERAGRTHHRQGLQDGADVDEDGGGAGDKGAYARPRRMVLDQHPRQPRRGGPRRRGEPQEQGGLQALGPRIDPRPREEPRALRRHPPRRQDQLLPSARRREGGLGQHRHLRVAQLPDADQGQLPGPGLDPGRPDRPRPRPLAGPRAEGRARGYPGVALVLLQEPDDPPGALSRARPLHPADEAQEHAQGVHGRGPHHPSRPGLLRV
ncbi:MAG: Inositol-1-phosphate synthase, partial [uncultured Rubrobacteraceae bacterium]